MTARTADATAAKMAARRTPPPPAAAPREVPAPSRPETFVRRNVDLSPQDATRLDRAVQEIADGRGWRRGNVGDVLVTLARLMLDDVELQQRVAEAVPVPKRVKYVR
jgi:hypothetical protein